MATITKKAPLPGGDGDDSSFTKRPEFRALLDGIKARGSSKLSAAQKISVQELARQKEFHHDPRVRAKLKEAYNMVAQAHLQYCLKLEAK